MKNLFYLFVAGLILIPAIAFSQGNQELQIHGNFQLDAQTYKADSIIGAVAADEHMLMMSYANIIANYKDFSAGIRYEAYLNSMQGFDPVNQGVGIPYFYATYQNDQMEITLGSFYDQFGSGLIFRTYEEKTLGYDNAMNGIRLRFSPGKGLTLKAIYGQQRLAQRIINNRAVLVLGRGIVRGLDAEINLNDFFHSMADSKTRMNIGGSFVSKYEIDDNPVYKIPENVGAGAARFNLSRGKINLMGEYAYKSQDPSAGGTDNSNGNVGQSFIYKNGQGALLSASYSQKGLGIYLMAKSIDNMNFRSERTAKLNDLSINYDPDITKNHTYSMLAFYPYGCQPNNEAGLRAEIMYKIPKKSLLGGHYGTNVSLSYSRMFGLKKEAINDSTSLISNAGTMGYKTNLLNFGDQLFYQDIYFEVIKKFNKKVKGVFGLQSLFYDNSIIHGVGQTNDAGESTTTAGNEEEINSFTAFADVSYKFASRRVLRTEIQHLATQHHWDSWAPLMFEYPIPG